MQRQDQPVTKPDFGWNKNRSFLVKAVNDKDNDGCHEMVQFLVLMRFHWLAKNQPDKVLFCLKSQKMLILKKTKGFGKDDSSFGWQIQLICGFLDGKWDSMNANFYFQKGCQHPGGSFIYWALVTSLTCKANVQSTYTSHQLLTLCTQITRWRVDISGDSAVKSPGWHQVLNLQPSSLLCSYTFFCWLADSKTEKDISWQPTVIQQYILFNLSIKFFCDHGLHQLR